MKRLLVDTNVLLDVLLGRLPWKAEADAVLDAFRDGQLAVVISALTIANAFYVGRRSVGTAAARAWVRDSLDAFEIVSVDRAILAAADRLTGSDFEDGIQIASAVAAGVDAIVTRDPKGFSSSPVPVLSPAELLSELLKDDPRGADQDQASEEDADKPKTPAGPSAEGLTPP